MPDSYLGVLRNARDSGLKIAGIDLPKDKRDEVLQKCLAAILKSDSPDDTKKRCEEIQKKACALETKSCEGRDCGMALALARLLEDRAARVLVLIGAVHARAGHQPTHLRALHGVSSKTYGFVSKLGQPINALYDPIQKAGLATRRLWCPTRRVDADEINLDSPTSLSTPYDGVIWVP